MSVFLLVFKQLVMMGLMIAIGFFLVKQGYVISSRGTLLNILLTRVVIPCVILYAFFTMDVSVENLHTMLEVVLLAAASLILSILAAYIIYPHKEKGHTPIHRNILAFPNDGFFGIPILQVLFGSSGVFAASMHITCMNLLTWTWGGSQFQKRKLRLKDILVIPTTQAALIGFAVFMIRFILAKYELTFMISLGELFYPIVEAIRYMKELNTPLAMIIVGINVANADWHFENDILHCIPSLLLRQIIFPLITLFVMLLLPLDKTLAFSIFVIVGCPAAMIISVMSTHFEQPDEEQAYATKTVIISTLSSLFTLPIMVTIGNLLMPVL